MQFLCSSTLGIKILLVLGSSGCTSSSYQLGAEVVSLLQLVPIAFPALSLGWWVKMNCMQEMVQPQTTLI